MSRCKRIEALAERICAFFGMDNVTEMIVTLWDNKRRNALAEDLKGTAVYCENDVTAYEASMLWREIITL